MIDLGPSVAVLRDEIDAFYAGFGNPTALQDAFRSAVLLIPLVEGSRITTSTYKGVAWICAFTGAEAYSRWLSARGELDAAGEYRYQTMSGWRLADYAAACTKPTGVTVDIIGPAPMAFPPKVTEDQGAIPQAEGA